MSTEDFGNSEKDDYSATFSYTSSGIMVQVTTDADLQSYREFAAAHREAYKLQVGAACSDELLGAGTLR